MKRTSGFSLCRAAIGALPLLAVLLPASAALTITNGDFEGSQFYTSTYTGSPVRDFFHRALWAANGDGWYNSNNPDSKFFVTDGGIDGVGKYGAKQSTTHHRGMVNVITDNRQTTGVVTLHLNVLFRAAAGAEGFRLKVWGVRESTPGQWDGWIDLTGPSGNDDGLDLRNFNNSLPPNDAGQPNSGAPSYTGADFTPLYTATQATLELSPGDTWQPVSFDIDLGSTGYDYILVGVAFHDSTGTPSGVDDLSLQAAQPVDLQLAASPAALQSGTHPISLSWTSEHPLAGSPTYTITTNKAGYGPYDVTAQTASGASTSPLVVDYDSSNGDITFTLTAQAGGGPAYTTQTTVALPPPDIHLAATPTEVTNVPSVISLSWNVANAPGNATYVITSNRTGIGPFYVTASTDANGASTVPVTVPYNRAFGDITFTLTVTDPATGTDYSEDLVVDGPMADLPNVLLILVDDMGWSDISPYGGEIQTPNLARLAADGLRFREFHNEARCAPTRCALLSGMHVQRSSTHPNDPLPPLRIDNNVTIAELLKSIGYRTYESGKWHISEYQNQAEYTPLQSPTNRGFDYAFNGSLWGGHLADDVGGSYWTESEFELCPADGEIARIKYDGTDPRAFRTPFLKTEAQVDYVLEYIRHSFSKNDGRPFFTYLAFHAPHFALSARTEDINRYTDVADPNPGDEDVYRYEDGWDLTRQRRYERQLAMGVTAARLSPQSPMPGGAVIPAWSSLAADRKQDLSRRMATYAAMVQELDAGIGRILDALEARGQLDSTIILFLSDNGGNYEQGLYGESLRTGADLANMGQSGTPTMWVGGGWANVSNTPFRYYKHHTHEGGDRTPMIVHWPAGLAPELRGKWTDQRGHVTDILPTLIDIAGVRYPDHFKGHPVDSADGKSLLPVIEGGSLAPRDLFIEHEENRAMYRGDWKLVTKSFSSPNIEDLAANTAELYNLREDPTEMNNLAFNRPQMLAEMITAFNAWVDGIPGLNSNRRITQITPEPRPFLLRGRELVADTFDRANVDDLDSVQSGISGTLLGLGTAPLNDVYFEGFNPAGTTITGKRLRLAGAVESGLRPNLDNPLVTGPGGFSGALDFVGFNSPAGADEFVGIAAGLTATQAQGGGAVDSASSFRGREDLAQGVADCFVEITSGNTIRVWVHGQVRDTIPVAAGPGTLVVTFALEQGFAAGDTVDLSVVYRGKKIHGSSFTWRKSGASYAGLSAGVANSVDVDNLVVRPAFLADTFVTVYNLGHGLNEFQSGAKDDPDGDGRTNDEEWAFGTDPSVPDSTANTPLQIDLGGADGFALLHRRASAYAEAGIAYMIRYSTDLSGPISSWHVLTPEQETAVEESDAYEQARLTLPASLRDEPRLFFAITAEE